MKWPARGTRPLLVVAVVAIVIAFLPAGKQDETVTPAKAQAQPPNSLSSQQTSRQQQSEQVHVELERLSQQKANAGGGKAVANAFNSTSWHITRPAPPPPPPPPPPAPTAPPLPFTYMGRYEDPPKLLVILASGNKVYTVSEGEVIDGNYRVDRITDSAVELVYLPLNINQSLSTIATPDNSQHRTGVEERYRRP